MTIGARGCTNTDTIKDDLLEYYKQNYPEREGMVISVVEDITSGWEAELYYFVVEFEEEGRTNSEERVARLYLGNYASDKAASEFKVMSRLFKAGYPVPRVFHLETDGSVLGMPFIVMEYIRGHTMRADLDGASEVESKALMTTFMNLWVDLHNLDGLSLFPGEFDEGGTPEYVESMVRRARKTMKEIDIEWLVPLVDWIEEHKAGVSYEENSIIHRDFHPDNILISDDGSPVVIDWTAVHAGDYRDDLAWTILLAGTYGYKTLRDAILEMYEEVSGREVRDIEFFEVMAICRRLLDVSSSLIRGAEGMGMRPGAEEMMRRDSVHLKGVYDLLIESTGLRIPEFEELLSSL